MPQVEVKRLVPVIRSGLLVGYRWVRDTAVGMAEVDYLDQRLWEGLQARLKLSPTWVDLSEVPEVMSGGNSINRSAWQRLRSKRGFCYDREFDLAPGICIWAYWDREQDPTKWPMFADSTELWKQYQETASLVVIPAQPVNAELPTFWNVTHTGA